MITNEKLNKIYDKVVDNNIFTTKELIEIGFTKEDLTKLVKDNVLKRVKRGEYTLVDIEKLFYYGKHLLFRKEIVRARAIFEACYKIDSKHGGVLFQLFLKNINERKYNEAFSYLEQLMRESSNEFYQKDSNVYLYLLDKIIDLPENYQNYINSLELSDLEIPEDDKRYGDKDYQNSIRRMIFQNENLIAFIRMKGIRCNIQNIIIKSLLAEILEREKIKAIKIKKLIKEEKYEEIIEFLSNQLRLGFRDEWIIKIAQSIIEIRERKEPIESNYSTDRLGIAIKENNFSKALSLCISYNNYTNRTIEEDPLYLLLCAIIKENEKVSNSDKNIILEIITALYEKNMGRALELINSALKEKGQEKYEALTINIIKLIIRRKKPNINDIKYFLEGILDGKINLNISQLINEYKISLKDNNTEKLDIINAIFRELESLGIKIPEEYSNLQIISKKEGKEENSTNQINLEITLRFIEMSINKRDIASIIKYLRVYLTNINKSAYEQLTILLIKLHFMRKSTNYKLIVDYLSNLKASIFVININDLVKEYEVSFQNKNYEKSDLILEILKEIEKLGLEKDITSNLKARPNEIRVEVKKEEQVIPPKEEQVIIMPKEVEITPEIKEFMESIYKRLEENSLIILDESDSSIIDIDIFNKEYNKAYAFKISDDRVVVKITRYVNREDAKEYTKNGDEAFNNGNYEEALKEYKELLPLKATFTHVYANIGICYMNLGNLPEAIKYLTIATGLSKLNSTLKYDYIKLINKLKSELEVKVKREASYGLENTNLNDYYGISNIHEVATLINEGKTIDEASQILNISASEKNMICLLLARDCYALKDYDLGDNYIRKVEENPYKSKQVLALLESLKQNRLLYQSLVSEDYEPLHSKVVEQTRAKTTKVSLKEIFKKSDSTATLEKTTSDKKTSNDNSETLDLITKRYQELKKQGEIIILKIKDTSRLDIDEFNRRYSDAEAFYIGLGSNKRIVIKLLSKGKINKREIIERAKEAYRRGDYKTALKENKKLLGLRENRPSIYGAIGLSYLKNNYINETIKYLSIATDLAEILDTRDRDYSELINKLKGIPTEENEDAKTFVRMYETEFTSDMHDNYGAKRLNEVLLLMNFQGMSATEACEGLCLDLTESTKIFIVLAKECYALKEFEIGDKYLIEAERRLPTPAIKRLINEIRSNKRFYSNRIDEDYKPLVRERTFRI